MTDAPAGALPSLATSAISSAAARGPTTLRTRLTMVVVFVAAIAIAAALVALRIGLTSRLQTGLQRSQQARIDRIVTSAIETQNLPADEPFAQVWVRSPEGIWKFINQTPAFERAQLLSGAQLQLASTQALTIDTTLPALGGRARLLAQPHRIGDVDVVIVVGSSLSELDRTRDLLVASLTVGGAGLVALSAFGAWLLAGAVLRPVQRMTDEAALIATSASAATLKRRLDLPKRHDEIAHLGATFNDLLERVEGAVQRERDFVDDASHELRTPLSILRGELELAAAEAADPHTINDPEKTTLLLGRLSTEVDRLGRLAEDLLVLARARSQQSAPPTSLELLSLVTAVAGRLSHGRRTKPVEVDGDSVRVLWRADHAERVLTNLLDNATRFATTKVRVHIESTEAEAIIRVGDDGQGFAPDFLPKAFERFAIADRARTRSGTGLGLAIVNELIDTAGGTVEAGTSDLGGAEVTITLPREVVAPAPAMPALPGSATAALSRSERRRA